MRFTLSILTLSAGMAPAAAQIPTYDLGKVVQFEASPALDTIPADPAARRSNAETIAMDATIYGLPAVLQYAEMYAQALSPTDKRYTGFDRFAHDRALAGPDYAAFKSPNSDTLYSNAWLDLTHGPLVVRVPPVPLKYYTLNFFDAYGNASNIGTRTFGSTGGTYLIAPVAWAGKVPPGMTVFRVATPHMWVLMRIFAQKPAEIVTARRLQDAVTITPLAGNAKASTPPAPPRPDSATATGFMAVLDHVLRTNGVPAREEAFVHRFQSIGLARATPFDPASLDPATKAGIEAGFAKGMAVIKASRAQLGVPTGRGWNKIEKARYGFNYLNRATINFVGLGANVSQENYSFNTFTDVAGKPLDGSKSRYTLALDPPPPVNAFWSVTLYDAGTYRLHPNPLDRYLINDRTPGLQIGPGGKVTITISRDKPSGKTNWLPAPNRPFYLALRAYLPKPALLAGEWTPQGVTPER